MEILYYIISFFIVINVIVFVHEYGHYTAAKQVGVKISTFSIGMGPEIFGFTDKFGTRWCFSLLPIGGYVMMLGDGDAASATEDEKSIEGLSEQEKNQSIIRKSAWEKIWIAFCGPFFNFIYAFVVIVLMAFFYGIPEPQTTIGHVMQDSPAMAAGLQSGETILAINDKKINRFNEVILAVNSGGDAPIKVTVKGTNGIRTVFLQPKIVETKTWRGTVKSRKLIGVSPSAPVFKKRAFMESISAGFNECYFVCKEMMYVFGKLFTGNQSIDNFGGFVKMAEIAGDLSRSQNWAMLIMFTVTLSLNLGIVNLFPLPILDGGRIFICLVEKIAGRKLNEKVLEYLMIACALLLFGLIIAMTVNDIMHIEKVNNFVMNLIR